MRGLFPRDIALSVSNLAKQGSSPPLPEGEAIFYLPEGKQRTFEMSMSKAPLRWFRHSRAGVYLPPISLPITFAFGGSKPPPYNIDVFN